MEDPRRETTALPVTGAPETRSSEATGCRATVVGLLAPAASEHGVRALLRDLAARGVRAQRFEVGPGVVVMHGLDESQKQDLSCAHGVLRRLLVPKTRYLLARRELVPHGSAVRVGPVTFGGANFPVVAGPCAVESRAQALDVARAVQRAGASLLRGGAFKPRTSPYDFQGLGLPAVEILAEVRAATGLPFITEVMGVDMIDAMLPVVDAFQVGARNMQNFDLLRALGQVGKPVLIKRGPAATIEEWLLAAEYVLTGGNNQVILCERGIRAFPSATRYTLDLASMALAKRETHLPIIVDPSHATGDPSLVGPMARAAMAAGADGLMLEVHAQPADALSDGFQALTPDQFAKLMDELRAMAPALGRKLAAPAPTPARIAL